jgi:cytochrome c-type biogenesis protein CcmE
MKLSHIIALIVIAVAIGIIVSTASDASTYVDFGVAEEMASQGSTKKIHVVGNLKKDPQGNIEGISYNPALDANHFEFMLFDQKNVGRKVIYEDGKPQDFGKAEQVVVIGQMKNGVFACDKILLKCPSKYQEGKAEFEEVKKTASL